MTCRTGPKHLVRKAIVIGGAVVLVRRLTDELIRPALDRAARQAQRRVRYAGGRLQGLGYRLQGRHPDLESGTMLADRVRSVLGPLEKQLDIPRVHVVAEDHVVLLHDVVPGHADAARIEEAVERVPGVQGVESYLHVGAIPADQRRSAGAGTAPRRFGTSRARTVPALVADLVPPSMGLSPEQATHVVESIFGEMRELVPEEDHDIAAVLPKDIRDLWQSSMPH